MILPGVREAKGKHVGLGKPPLSFLKDKHLQEPLGRQRGHGSPSHVAAKCKIGQDRSPVVCDEDINRMAGPILMVHTF